MRPKHEDFSFYDYEQTPQWQRLREERDARVANRIRRERAARPHRSMFAWIHEGIQALLRTGRLF